MSYELFNEKIFKFDNDTIAVDLQYIETLAPSDALALIDGFDYTGFKLWPGSEYLCQIIVKHKHLFLGKTLLELGSGVGLAGLVASNYAKAPVLLTDGEDYIVDVLKKNVSRNNLEEKGTLEFFSLLNGWRSYALFVCLDSGTKVAAATLYWGKDEAKYLEQYPAGFEVIMGGDLIYSKEVVAPLLKCIDALLAKTADSVFFMVYVDRAGTGLGPAFLNAAAEAPYHLTSTVEQLEVKVEEADTYLYQLRRKL